MSMPNPQTKMSPSSSKSKMAQGKRWKWQLWLYAIWIPPPVALVLLYWDYCGSILGCSPTVPASKSLGTEITATDISVYHIS